MNYEAFLQTNGRHDSIERKSHLNLISNIFFSFEPSIWIGCFKNNNKKNYESHIFHHLGAKSKNHYPIKPNMVSPKKKKM